MAGRIGIISIFIFVLALQSAQAAPRAAAGLLDLGPWRFEHDGVVPLTGEWEFYWGRLLQPTDFSRADPPRPTGTINIPGRWNEYAATQGARHGDGYATYRLRIRLSDEPPPDSLALSIPWMFTSHKMWVNGRLVASNGSVGTGPDNAVPEFLPMIAPVDIQSGNMDIIIQISNFTHRNGGLWNAPILGTYPQIARRALWRQVLDAAVSGTMLLMAVYHFMMYFLMRRWAEWLYLGLTAMISAARTLVSGEHLLGQIVGGLPWGLEIRVEYIAGYGFMIAFLAFLRALFPKDTSRAVITGGQVAAALGIAITTITPVRISSQVIPFFVVISLIFVFYSATVFVIAWQRQRDGAGPLLLGGLVLMLSLVHDLLGHNLAGVDVRLWSVGLSVLLLFQSLTVARRFSAVLKREAALAAENESLLNMVRTQLEEVERSRDLIATLDQDVRRKIAERLHGNMQNRLLKAWHQLAAAKEAYGRDRRRAEDLIEQVRADIEHIREVDIRQVSHELHPSIVRMGLIPAIESLANQYGDIVPIHIDVDDAVQTRDDGSPRGIPEPIRLVVFRVLEECLGNIQAHAQATAVSISIRLDDDDSLTVTIHDNGRGFNPQTVEPHLGLHTIAASVATVDGHWELSSAPGKGTRIQCRLPLSTHRNPPG